MSFSRPVRESLRAGFPFRTATLEFLAARLPARGRVLDLGCGTGHYAGALAARGLEAVGLDLDQAMIDAARERYGAALFVVGDLGEVATITDHAEGAFCIGNVLPHLPPDRLDRFLADLAGVLEAGAPWIVHDRELDRLLPLAAAHDFPPLAVADGLVFQRRYEPGPDGEVTFRTALSRDHEILFEGEATLWPRTSDDLAARQAAAGFELVEQAGDSRARASMPRHPAGCVQVYRRAGG